MAKVVQFTDDIDGNGEDVETVFFMANGQFREIDLSKANRDKFARALKPYVEKGRESTRVRVLANIVSTVNGNAQTEAETIRAWAKANGHEVSERGRLPQDIIDAYNKDQEQK